MFGKRKKNVDMVDATDDFDKQPQIPEPPKSMARPVPQPRPQPHQQQQDTVTLELTEAEFNFVMAMLQNAEPIRIYAASQDGEAGWNVLQKMRQMVE